MHAGFQEERPSCYTPDPGVWRRTAARRRLPFGPSWWHVSAYGDYDLATARRLGLTCVYVSRDHARFGPADLYVRDLEELAGRVAASALSDRKSTRLNSSHLVISYAVFCLKKKTT